MVAWNNQFFCSHQKWNHLNQTAFKDTVKVKRIRKDALKCSFCISENFRKTNNTSNGKVNKSKLILLFNFRIT